MKKLLILYTKAPQEVFNRKSALGSYINCLANVLRDSKTEVYLNGVHLDEIPESGSANDQSSVSSGLIRKVVPAYIKKIKRERGIINTADNLTREIVEGNVKYDHVLEFYTLGSLGGKIISEKMNCPLSIIYDGPIVEEYEFFNGGKPALERKIVQREKESLVHANNVVVYSEPMKKYVVERTGTRANFGIHQNVDFTRFESYAERQFNDLDPINICFIGSFLKWHNVDLLVFAMQDLIQSGIKARLFLVGHGQEHEAIVNLVNRVGLNDHVEITGFLDGQDLYQLKEKMHIGVMPGSNWYGAPNKIFEYGAMKMAVLAPKTPTIDYLFSKDEVQFFEWKNQKDLTNQLKTLCSKAEIEKKAETLFEKINTKYSEKITNQFYKQLMELDSE